MLKVYHTQTQPKKPTLFKHNPFHCESNAYLHLKEHGLCGQGIVPDFLGVIENIDPNNCNEQWAPHLKHFKEDELLPNAVLIEYVPNIQQLDLGNYTDERAKAFCEILQEIHDVGVCHSDPYPRNMMVQVDTGRVLWIDSDRAQTMPYGPIRKRQAGCFEMDRALTEESMEGLREDVKEGRLSKAWGFYYHYS